jgi:hypothetical protein
MQNKEILEALLVNAQKERPKYSFVIGNNEIDKVIGDAKDNLEVNNYIIRNVKIIFNTSQIVVVRKYTYSTCGWKSNDSALMLSCIKKVYKGEKLIFNCTTKE